MVGMNNPILIFLAVIGLGVLIKIVYDVLLNWYHEEKDNPHHLPSNFDIEAMKQAEKGDYLKK